MPGGGRRHNRYFVFASKLMYSSYPYHTTCDRCRTLYVNPAYPVVHGLPDGGMPRLRTSHVDRPRKVSPGVVPGSCLIWEFALSWQIHQRI